MKQRTFKIAKPIKFLDYEFKEPIILTNKKDDKPIGKFVGFQGIGAITFELTDLDYKDLFEKAEYAYLQEDKDGKIIINVNLDLLADKMFS